MKNHVKKISLLVVLLATITGFSQENNVTTDSRTEFKIGLKAGINFSNVYDEQGQDFVASGKAGFAAGGFFSIPIGKFLGVQPEIMYSQKGFKATGTVLGLAYDYTRTTSFVDLPILLQIKPIPMVTFVAGPQLSYLLDTKNNFNGTIISSQEESINSQNYKKTIIGFVVGADLNVSQFVISGRAGWDISKSDTDGNSTTPRYKNQVIQFTLGYNF